MFAQACPFLAGGLPYSQVASLTRGSLADGGAAVPVPASRVQLVQDVPPAGDGCH